MVLPTGLDTMNLLVSVHGRATAKALGSGVVTVLHYQTERELYTHMHSSRNASTSGVRWSLGLGTFIRLL